MLDHVEVTESIFRVNGFNSKVFHVAGKDYIVDKKVKGNALVAGKVYLLDYNRGMYGIEQVVGFGEKRTDRNEADTDLRTVKEVYYAFNVKNMKALEDLDIRMTVKNLVKENVGPWYYVYNGRWSWGTSAEKLTFYELKEYNEANYEQEQKAKAKAERLEALQSKLARAQRRLEQIHSEIEEINSEIEAVGKIMFIKQSTFEEFIMIRGMTEGIVLLGAGGEQQKWIDGVTELLKEAEIVKDNFQFDRAYSLVTSEGRHDLLLIPEWDKVDMGKLAIWRIAFGKCSWLSDYVVNYADQQIDYAIEQFEEENNESQ